MKVHILGLFPELLQDYFNGALLGRAQEKQLLSFYYHQLRDWSLGKYNAVDDKAYGGGPGMVFLPEVLCSAVRDLKSKHDIKKVVLTSPAGQKLTPQKAEELSQNESVLFICGRYEGVDQRAIDLVVDEEISIGDYVMTGGELAAGVMVDAMSRYIPGVVGKEESVRQDSHQNGLLEQGQYTRPETFENLSVPPVLLSGHHKNIEEWKRKESIKRTWERRPELFKKAGLTKVELSYIEQLIRSRRS